MRKKSMESDTGLAEAPEQERIKKAGVPQGDTYKNPNSKPTDEEDNVLGNAGRKRTVDICITSVSFCLLGKLSHLPFSLATC